MNRRVLTILGITLILIIFSIIKLKSNKQKVDSKLYIHDTTTAILVEVNKPTFHSFENSFSFLGTFDPFRMNTIGSDGAGKIIKLGFQEGDKISAGQFLAKIDDEMLTIQLENAEINVEGQRNDDTRNSNLIKDNVISGVQSEKTKLALKSAQTQVKQIKKQLKNATISAPFSGVVTKKMIDLGSVVNVGTPILELTDISSLKLNISVPERDILKFKVGQTVNVQADVYANKKFSGRVSNISVKADASHNFKVGQTVNVQADVYANKKFSGRVSNISVKADASHNFKVEITIANSIETPLMAGMYGSVLLQNSKTVNALSIPRKALLGSSKEPQVFVVKNGKAKRVSFTAGTSDGEFIEIIDGISKNDILIVKGQINVQNNSNVITK